MVDEARRAGFADVIVDISWSPEMGSEDAWLEVPDGLTGTWEGATD